MPAAVERMLEAYQTSKNCVITAERVAALLAQEAIEHGLGFLDPPIKNTIVDEVSAPKPR